MSNARLQSGGRIDRSRPLTFTFDGRTLQGFAGDTLASALLANGVERVTTSQRYGRPRGLFGAGVEEPNALVQIEEPFPEPMLTATTVELYDGLVARSLAGKGRLADVGDPARYDATHAHCDVLVVGGGPAGLSAARVAARSGVRVLLIDDQPELGGSLLGDTAELDGAPAAEWAADVARQLAESPNVRVLTRTNALGIYDENYVIALEHRTDFLGAAAPENVARQRIWRIRAKQVVLATGGHDRPITFADSDRPGVLLAAAARTYLNRYAVLPGKDVVVFTTNDSAYAAALDFRRAGATVTVVDARATAPAEEVKRCADAGIEVLSGQVVTGVSGVERVTSASVAPFSNGSVAEGNKDIACDLLLVSGGWNPALQLVSQSGSTIAYDAERAMVLPANVKAGTHVVGSVNGTLALAGCLAEGARAGAEAMRLAGGQAADVPLPSAEEVAGEAPLALWYVPHPGEQDPYASHFLDLQRDATVADVLRGTGAGLRSVEHVKRYTTIGTAHDQGRTSNLLTSGVVASATGLDVLELGVSSYRP
ncbi:MAG: 2Fe-2S iron-sulfur cluster-binding protein, partial [Actinomycetes bacterium]